MRRTLLALLLVGAVGCTDRSLLRNTDAAYQYQKGIYRMLCPPVPVPASGDPCVNGRIAAPMPQQTACQVRDYELTRDCIIIGAALDAVTKSQGGKLPPTAIADLKAIEAQLTKAATLP